MTTATELRPRNRSHPLRRLAGSLPRAAVLFRLALAVVALHVIDDSFLQPEPGTGPGDHLVSGLVPLAALGFAVWLFPRLRPGGQGALALFFAPLGIAAGAEAFYYSSELGASGDDFSGLLAIPAGLLLLTLGVVTLWRTRRTEGPRTRRYARRGLLGAAGAAVGLFVLYPLTFGYVSTKVAPAEVPAAHLGVPYEDVTFETSDGLELEGWYIPSRNGAAVIAFPGRRGPQAQARMLARHGYGVLLFDRRGEGRSEGRPHAYGWGGDEDVKAAVAYLQGRDDVDPDRIGGIGLSVGGELLLEAAAESGDLAAVVSDGAGSRMLGEELDKEMGGLDRALYVPAAAIKNAALSVFSDQAPPAHLADLVGRIAPRPLLLIAAPNSPNGEELNRRYVAAAGETATLWEIPEAGHTGGLAARPQEYGRRVIGFFDDALLG